eukprot:tig00001027_g6380.t1
MDLDLIRLHTRLLVRAKEWVESGSHKNSSKLLTGRDLREALDWRERVKESSRQSVNSKLLEEQNKFINASRRRSKVRKAILITVSAIAIFAIIAGLIAAIIAGAHPPAPHAQRRRRARDAPVDLVGPILAGAAIEATKAKNEAETAKNEAIRQEGIAKTALADLSVSNAKLSATYADLSVSNAKLNATYANLTVAYSQLEQQNILINKQKEEILQAYKDLQESLRSSSQRRALLTRALRVAAGAGTYLEGSSLESSTTTGAGAGRRHALADPAAGGHGVASAPGASGGARLRGKREEGGAWGKGGRGLRFSRDLLAGADATRALNLRELASPSKQQYTLVFPMVAFSDNNDREFLANVVLLKWREARDLESDVIKAPAPPS